MRLKLVLPLILAGVVTNSACTGPEPAAPDSDFTTRYALESELEFVTWGPGGPPLDALEVAFTVVKGQKCDLVIRLRDDQGVEHGDQGPPESCADASATANPPAGGQPKEGKFFFRIKINPGTLHGYGNGTLIHDKEAVQIHMTVHYSRLMVTFSPHLEFNPFEPAQVELRYEAASADFVARESEIGLWRQEDPGQPWELVRSAKVQGRDEIRAKADLGGFTRYALAIGR